jgi:hypothetical protein
MRRLFSKKQYLKKISSYIRVNNIGTQADTESIVTSEAYIFPLKNVKYTKSLLFVTMLNTLKEFQVQGAKRMGRRTPHSSAVIQSVKRKVKVWCEMFASLGVSQLEQCVSCVIFASQ